MLRNMHNFSAADEAFLINFEGLIISKNLIKNVVILLNKGYILMILKNNYLKCIKSIICNIRKILRKANKYQSVHKEI